jgi:diguanylate cyclase (GGDEF)-like protein
VQAAREDWPQALQDYSATLELESARGDAMGMAYTELGSAGALVKLDRPAEAMPRLRRAITQFEALGDKIQAARANVLLGAALLRLDQLGEAQTALQRAGPALRDSPDEVLRSEWLELRAALMARLGNWREAHAALSAHAEIDKRLRKRQLSQQTARLRLQFNREHDEQDIRTLQLAVRQGQDLRQLQAVALTLFVLLLGVTVAYAAHKVRESRRLRTLSLSDELTGLANRRATLAQLQAAMVSARERAAPLSVMMVDVDHFKQVNDTHGHAAGDDVLRHLSRLLPTSLRSLDRLGRIGGEEFLAVLPDATLQQAATIAERMRASLAATPAPTGAGPLPVTASIGVAMLRPGESLDALLDRADQALYAAKGSGRNAVAEATA